jgi:hypothetical protein
LKTPTALAHLDPISIIPTIGAGILSISPEARRDGRVSIPVMKIYDGRMTNIRIIRNTINMKSFWKMKFKGGVASGFYTQTLANATFDF